MAYLNIKGYQVLIDDEDLNLIESYNWHVKAPHKSQTGTYFITNIARKDSITKRDQVYLHRLILGVTDPAILIDHIDCNTLDCRKSNMRTCTRAENNRNVPKRLANTSGLKGVYRSLNRWKSQIFYNNKCIYLGTFKEPWQAHEAYCEAAKEYHGEFAHF